MAASFETKKSSSITSLSLGGVGGRRKRTAVEAPPPRDPKLEITELRVC
jgi:hypothetical protein